MDDFEKKINALLAMDSDIAIEILDAIERYCGEDSVSLRSETLNKMTLRLAGNAHEEEIWDNILSVIPVDEIPNELIEYLIKKDISLLSLCHLPLEDKWLMKLMDYDDAPLYTLAKRYYLSDKYSMLDFSKFYQQYMRSNSSVSTHLLELYGNTDKRSLLIFLCQNNKEFKDKEKLEWNIVADQVKVSAESDNIADVYQKYKNVGVIMLAIAGNLFSPDNILAELSLVKGVSYATEIRKTSKETLKLRKTIIEA